MLFDLWDKIVHKAHEPKSLIGFPPNRALISATDTFMRKAAIVTKRAPHIRDATDLKRFMLTVVVALLPCLLWGIYNTGRNSYLAIGVEDPGLIACFVEGAVWVV